MKYKSESKYQHIDFIEILVKNITAHDRSIKNIWKRKNCVYFC